MKFKEIGGVWGAMVGFMTPIMALFIRSLLPERMNHIMHHVRQEVFSYPFFYSYMFLTVPVAFAIFGFYLGHARDKVLNQNAQLERLNAILRNQSRTDDLTGHYNHRHIIMEAEKEIERARRYKHLLSAMMIDIDQFKMINDRYGHLAGDEVLRATADVLDAGIRKIDILGRYGGDEFFILLPETDSSAAMTVAERVLRNVRQHKFTIEGKPISLTISVGLSSFDKMEGVDAEALVDKADKALLEAKKTGKNRISVV